MKWLRTIAVLTLAVLWLPVSVHCQLEQLPGLEFLSCDSHEDSGAHQSDDCEGDACAVVESGLYKSEERQISLAAPDFDAFDFIALLSNQPRTPMKVHGPAHGTAPPELSRVWQFTFRAALPPRAPSLAS